MSVKKDDPIEVELIPVEPYLRLSRVSQLGTLEVISERTLIREILVKAFLSDTDIEERVLQEKVSEQVLDIRIVTEEKEEIEFSWYATNVTSTQVSIQLEFEDPLAVSQ